jgi:hypothetical protein
MANLILSFVPSDPAPINGYVVKYRKVGDTSWTTLSPQPTSSPITIPGVDQLFAYEGTIQSDCSNGFLSHTVPFRIEPCIGDNKKFVNGICETGTRINISSTPDGGGDYTCVYRYQFSDGSVTSDFVETTDESCPLGPV